MESGRGFWVLAGVAVCRVAAEKLGVLGLLVSAAARMASVASSLLSDRCRSRLGFSLATRGELQCWTLSGVLASATRWGLAVKTPAAVDILSDTSAPRVQADRARDGVA